MSTAIQSPEQIVADAQISQEEVFGEFLSLARRVANDEAVSAAEVGRVCAAAGFPVDEHPGEFPQMVERFRHRKLLRAKATRLEPCEREMTEARAAIDEANSELEIHVLHHQRVTAPLQQRIRELRAEYAEAKSIPSELLSSNPHPGLRRKLKLFQHDLDRLSFAKNQAADRIVELRGRAENARETSDRITLERLADQADAEVKKLETEIAKGEAERAALVAQIREL